MLHHDAGIGKPFRGSDCNIDAIGNETNSCKESKQIDAGSPTDFSHQKSKQRKRYPDNWACPDND